MSKLSRNYIPACCLLAIMIAGLSPVGWLFDIPWLRAIPPSSPRMMLSTSVWLWWIAGTLLAAHQTKVRGDKGSLLIVAWIMALFSALIGITFLIQAGVGWILGTESPVLISGDIAEEFSTSPQTAMSGVLLSIAIGVSLFKSRSALLASQSFNLAVTLIGLMFALGHFYLAEPLIRLGAQPEIGISLLTLAGLMSLAFGTFGLSTNAGFIQLLVSRDSAGAVTRILLLAIPLPIAMSFVFRELIQLGWLGPQSSYALQWTMTSALFIWLITWIGQLLVRRDQLLQENQQQRELELALREKENMARAEAESHERFVSVFDFAPVGLLLVDNEGLIRLANTFATSLFRYKTGDLAGKRVETLVPSESRKTHVQWREVYQAAPTRRRMSRNRELWGLTRTGEHIPLEVELQPVQIRGEQFTLAAIVDIAERHHANLALRSYATSLKNANLALESFAYAASHDLRAPMRAIANLASWLQSDLEGTLPEDSARHLDQMMGRVHRMEKLLTDLLEFATVAQQDSRVETVSVGALAEDAFQAVSPPETFSLVVKDSAGEFETPRVPLEQCLRNLIDNAIKHHDCEAGRIEVSAKLDNDRIRIRVVDDGPGIPMEFRNRVFEAFKTLKPRDVKEGSGIGLSLAMTLVTRFRGQLHIEENEPRGSIFAFDWPIKFEPIEASLEAPPEIGLEPHQ